MVMKCYYEDEVKDEILTKLRDASDIRIPIDFIVLEKFEYLNLINSMKRDGEVVVENEYDNDGGCYIEYSGIKVYER